MYRYVLKIVLLKNVLRYERLCFVPYVDANLHCPSRRWPSGSATRKHYHENPLDTRGRAKRAPCIQAVFMGIFARVHELFAILAMRRRLSTRKSHGTPGQDNSSLPVSRLLHTGY